MLLLQQTHKVFFYIPKAFGFYVCKENCLHNMIGPNTLKVARPHVDGKPRCMHCSTSL